MALRQLLLSKKIEEARARMNELETAREALEARRAGLDQREAELVGMNEEVNAETTEEEQAALTEAMEQWEADDSALRAEETENAEKREELQTQINDLTQELEQLNERAKPAPSENVPEEAEKAEDADEIRSERSNKPMNIRTMFGSAQERAAIFAREDVKEFAQRLRQIGKENRSVTGGALLIPEVMLPLIREITAQNSKLLPLVNTQRVGGSSRQTVMGTIPEAVWTEMCGKINELTLAFTAAEVDGYKVAAYVPVCNALIEDNDVNLVSQVIWALGCAIALALDKAILYGTGTKMPLGIVTRLAQTSAPASYSAKERAWADLHTSNILKITAANSVGLALFQKLIEAFGAASVKYGTNGMFFAMNHKTKMNLMAEALNFNANGAIVAGLDNTMPVLGGQIVELDFIPDSNIVAGYGCDYLLAERAGVSIEQSEHVRFLDDQTVFRGKARYDGKPVIAEGFAVIGINNVTPTTTATFASDTANA